MTAKTLPKKLIKEPMVDAIFEMRFSSSTAASSVLPGFFFAKLQPINWKVTQLPISEIPNQIRNADANLRYAPLMRIDWDNFIILIGDYTVGIGCKIPYQGWIKFKERIERAVQIVMDTNIIQAIERYSLKYVDIIDGKDLAERIQRVNINIMIGSYPVENNIFTARVEIPKDNFLKVIQISSDAKALMEGGKVLEGVLVDIDTICRQQTSDLANFKSELSARLEDLHQENKITFFDCLRQETIDYLEPVYE